jgi:hypothetical protein
VVTVLYFYSEEKCPQCSNMGVLLTYYKKKLDQKLLIFPINIDLEKDEKIITLLRKRYEVYSLPTIIVEDSKFEGFLDKSELGKLICSNFQAPAQSCEQ